MAAGSYSIPLTVPDNLTPIGVSLFQQGVVFTDPNGPEFANRTPFRMW